MLTRSILFLTALCVGLTLFPPSVLAQKKPIELTPANVENAIKRGVAYLKSRQSKQTGGWEDSEGHRYGVTGMCTLALLSCGMEARDPVISSALKLLRSVELDRTYVVSVRLLVLCQAGLQSDLPIIRGDVDWLVKHQLANGGWEYGTGLDGLGDASLSQFAMMALDAAASFGIDVPDHVWRRAELYWTQLQNADGGWGYGRGTRESTGSMTCAGITGMIIVRGRLSGNSRVNGDQILCCQPTDANKDPVKRGLEWLGKNFSVTKNPNMPHYWMYYMYALERVGRLTGQRFIGDFDWYREGTRILLERQDSFQGFWLGFSIFEDSQRDLCTAYALLFLSKGKRQVVVSRAEYGPEQRWNLHPGGLRQLVREVERHWRRDLTWQTARIQGATVEELLQAPVLFLSGTHPLEFTDNEKELLRDYILQGGFIFAEAAAGNGCGDPKPFEDSFKKLCQELLGAKLERLPPEHPLWTAEVEVDPRHLPKEFVPYGVQACCRTSMVYSPIAISCRWELHQPDRKSPYSEKVTQELTACVGFGRNVLAYATGRQLRDKLEKPLVAKSGAAGGDAPRGTIVIPRLEVGAGGELAPRALPNLMEWMRTSTPLRVKTEKEAISLTTTNLQNYAIVFVHGRDRVLFSQSQRNALKEFFTISDGTLIANSICGAKAFTESFRSELKAAVPEMVFEEKLPESHPLFTKAYHGFDIRRVKLRKPLGDGTKVSFTAETTFPVIEVGRIGNRIAVIFSPYDLSCALENQYSPQCAGYTIDDAARIGINMILYALQQ